MLAAAQRGYRRRRGWLAWHVARLNLADPKAFPDLADLTGDARPDRAAQGGATMLHNIRLLKAAMAARRGNDA
ncbi:hypothetical protein ACWPMX_07780 [Tsuneonella sp. HG094]